MQAASSAHTAASKRLGAPGGPDNACNRIPQARDTGQGDTRLLTIWAALTLSVIRGVPVWFGPFVNLSCYP